jgi:hypothetical protein
MTFSYLPVHVGFAVGPAVGSVVTQTPLGIFAIFPVAAVITAVGIGAMVVAARQRKLSPGVEDTVPSYSPARME